MLSFTCAPPHAKPDAVDGINHQAETVNLVLDGEFQRRIDAAFFLVAAHVQFL